jgi:hypothetical protein
LISFALWKVRPYFDRCLPTEKVDVVANPEAMSTPIIHDLVHYLANCFEDTNAALKSRLHLKDLAKDYQNIWFYSLDQIGLHQIYASLKDQGYPVVGFDKFDCGYDVKSRQWTHSGSYLSLDEIVTKIETLKIRRIISVWTHLTDYFQANYLDLSVILRWLGVELIVVETDLYDDNSYFCKGRITCTEFRRISILPHMTKPWDERYHYRVDYFMPSIFPKKPTQPVPKLPHDYRLAVIANSRLDLTQEYLEGALHVLERTSNENIYTDFYNWIFALRDLVLKDETLSDLQRERVNHYLNRVQLAGVSFLKYETVESLQTKRGIDIFGDAAWGVLFPEHYRNKYLSNEESSALFKKGQHLQLLANQNFSYFENNPNFQSVIQMNIPFLSSPALISPRGFESLEMISYRNSFELSEKLERVNEIFENDEFNRTLQSYCEIFEESLQTVTRMIGSTSSTARDRFSQICEESFELFEKKLSAFSQLHREALMRDYDQHLAFRLVGLHGIPSLSLAITD